MTLNREGKDSVHASEACMTLEEQHVYQSFVKGGIQ